MSMVNDEIDLRPYILAVIRYKWLMILIALVLGITGYVITSRQPRVYRATATLLFIRSQPTLKLADQFPTVAESVDANAKIRAFLTIAQEPAIAIATIEELGNRLPEAKHQAASLGSAITAVNEGDIIKISAFDPDPELAAEIANAWAAQTAKAINLAYGADRTIPEIELQLAETKTQYETAQASLEDFIRENNLTYLEQQSNEARFILNSLIQQRAKRLDFYDQRAHSLQEFIVQAEALKNQLASGGRSTAAELGDALAILNARANAYGIAQVLQTSAPLEMTRGSSSSSDLPMQSQQPDKVASFTINISVEELLSNGDTAADFAADLEQIIELARGELIKAQEQIEALSLEEQDPESVDQITQVNRRLQELETQLEQKKARQRELSSERDISWQAYTAMVEKKAELQTSTQTSNQVSLVNTAIIPTAPEPRGGLRNTIIAGAAGFILAFLVVILMEWWRQLNLNQSVQPAQTTRSS